MSELVQHCKDLLKQENKLLICGHDIATFLSGQEVCFIWNKLGCHQKKVH